MKEIIVITFAWNPKAEQEYFHAEEQSWIVLRMGFLLIVLKKPRYVLDVGSQEQERSGYLFNVDGG